MYQVLQEQVIPRFYDRDADGVPRRWVAMMKRAIQTLVPRIQQRSHGRGLCREDLLTPITHVRYHPARAGGLKAQLAVSIYPIC